MSQEIKEQCNYLCGPYKGYCGRAEYDHDDETFHGEVAGTRDVVTFEGATIAEVREAFKASVDDYLAFCASRGESPEKPFSGKFVTRMPPELHQVVNKLAEQAGKSLNQFVCDALAELAAARGVTPFEPSVKSAPRKARRIPRFQATRKAVPRTDKARRKRAVN